MLLTLKNADSKMLLLLLVFPGLFVVNPWEIAKNVFYIFHTQRQSSAIR